MRTKNVTNKFFGQLQLFSMADLFVHFANNNIKQSLV